MSSAWSYGLEPLLARPVAHRVADPVAELGRQPAALDRRAPRPSGRRGAGRARASVRAGRERVLHLVAVVERLLGARRSARAAGSAMPAIRRSESLDPRLLRRRLRVVGEILEAAAAAGREVLARRLDPLRARLDHLDRARPPRGGAAPSSRARARCRPAVRAARRRRNRRAARRRSRRRRASRPRARPPPLAEPARPCVRGYRPRSGRSGARSEPLPARSCSGLPVRAVLCVHLEMFSLASCTLELSISCDSYASFASTSAGRRLTRAQVDALERIGDLRVVLGEGLEVVPDVLGRLVGELVISSAEAWMSVSPVPDSACAKSLADWTNCRQLSLLMNERSGVVVVSVSLDSVALSSVVVSASVLVSSSVVISASVVVSSVVVSAATDRDGRRRTAAAARRTEREHAERERTENPDRLQSHCGPSVA